MHAPWPVRPAEAGHTVPPLPYASPAPGSRVDPARVAVTSRDSATPCWRTTWNCSPIPIPDRADHPHHPRGGPGHRQHRVHLDPRGEAARRAAQAGAPGGPVRGDGHAHPAAARHRLGRGADRTLVRDRRPGCLRSGHHPHRRRPVPAGQGHLGDPRAARGRGARQQRQGRQLVRVG